MDDTVCQSMFSCYLIHTTATFEREKLQNDIDRFHKQSHYLPYDVSPRIKNCFSANSCCSSAVTLVESVSKKSGNWRAICRRREVNNEIKVTFFSYSPFGSCES